MVLQEERKEVTERVRDGRKLKNFVLVMLSLNQRLDILICVPIRGKSS